MTRLAIALMLGALMLMTAGHAQDELTENLFANPSFEEGLTERQPFGVPIGWTLYNGDGEDSGLELSDDASEGGHALVIRDGDTTKEIGISQEVEAEGGIAYEASAMVKALRQGGGAGAHIQLRFAPSDEYRQVGLEGARTDEFTRISVVGLAPEDTTSIRVYYYTHRGPTPHLLLDDVRLIGGVEPPPPPPPEPVPPVYDELKDLHLQTDIVRDGEARATIVSPERYAEQAAAIADAIEGIAAVRPEVVADTDEVAAVPPDDGHLDRNFILLGNRSTNAMLEELYNRFYTLLDLRYPGPGGHVVRTCHNPFGDGHNLVYVGGSDDAGVAGAADAFIAALNEAGGGRGELVIERLMAIEPGDGVEFSHNPAEIEMWDASRGYGSTGYFGWNSISKHAAAYYMTGDEYHARQFIRLAFPDAEAKKQIAEIDGERIENKDDPLKGPYHYNAHMMILFWDLIEESPVFSDEERLAVTNAFSRQLEKRAREGIYRLQQPRGAVGSRHGQYSAISLYCLARYFAKDYPEPVWPQGMLGAKMEFACLEEHAWVQGEADNLFWYNTGHAPILRFMLLSGWRAPLENGVLAELLRGQEILATGKHGDWDLHSASITFLHRAAYLTQDGRWLEYRNRTGVDLSVPRVGQSFWPEEHLQPELPADMVGHWSVHELPLPMWQSRGSGLPWEHSFQFASYRSAPDASGDYVLLDGYNGASRNPYHTFAILELRLDGATLLKGYRNQVLTRLDGMVEPKVAMDGALRTRDVVGQTALAVGEVPNAAYCNWRRTLAQRVGRYALVVDQLTARESSENLQVQTLWEVPSGQWQPERNAIGVSAVGGPYTPVGWRSIRALDMPHESDPAGEEFVAEHQSLGIVLLRATEPGQWLEMILRLDEPLEGQLYADFLRYVDRGVFRILLDGVQVVERYDSYAQAAETDRVDLGHHRLEAGEHRLRVEVVERGGGGERAFIGLMGVSLKPDDAPAEEEVGQVHEILACDPVVAHREGRVHTLEWVGAVEEGQTLTFFSLVGSRAVPNEGELACLRLAENAALLGLPEPAVAVAGEYRGTQAELAIISSDHLFGLGLTAASADRPLLAATAPVSVDWDFESGTLAVHANEPASLTLRLVSDEGVALDGEAAALRSEEAGVYALAIPVGEHEITGARPLDELLGAAHDWLASMRADAEAVRAEAAQAEPPGALPELPAIEQVMTATFEGAIEHVMTIPDGEGGRLICAAEAEAIHLLRPDGQVVVTAATDGAIRDLHWWPEQELLLAACADERLIAFDRSGERRWVFVSEMDPAVFRAAKTYWFKSAAAHAGLWGVTTATFIGGESQAIIGSACTLEFIDGDGNLVHRMPQFWGDPHVFQIIDGPGESVNLLAARRINGTDRVGIINSETLDPGQRGFYGTPPGHTHVGGWSSLNRYHLFYEDLDGDGEREVISEVNGSWNRVTVWDAGGSALFNASFGPGAKSPTRNMRDLVVADLDGDGTMEVVTATSSGLVVCLDHELKKEWARAMPAAPNVMVAFPGPRGQTLLVGCDDGTLVELDAAGELLSAGQVGGRPAADGMVVLQAEDLPGDGPLAVVGTSAGQVVAVRPE